MFQNRYLIAIIANQFVKFFYLLQVPDNCPPGHFYNLTRGYIKIRGDSCSGGDDKLFEPHKVACPLKEEKEFLILAKRDQIWRVDLTNLSYHETLPINGSNVITVEYDMKDGCLFYGDVKEKTIFKQCLNGSETSTVVQNTETVEGNYFTFFSSKQFQIVNFLV